MELLKVPSHLQMAYYLKRQKRKEVLLSLQLTQMLQELAAHQVQTMLTL